MPVMTVVSAQLVMLRHETSLVGYTNVQQLVELNVRCSVPKYDRRNLKNDSNLFTQGTDAV